MQVLILKTSAPYDSSYVLHIKPLNSRVMRMPLTPNASPLEVFTVRLGGALSNLG